MKRALCLFATVAIAACSAGETSAPALPETPVQIFPEQAPPTPFTRAYGLTESPDGAVRVFAREQNDLTNLYEVRREADGSWSEPRELDFPRRNKLTNPSFSFADGMLYYASDVDILERGQRDANIWRVSLTDDGWGTPEHLPASINTGADELNPAMDRAGRLYFTSNGYDSIGGHDIFEAALDPETGEWQVSPMPDGVNSAKTEAHLAVTPDGNRLFFYSHRQPKLGVVDIWTVARGADDLWGAPENLGEPVNTAGIDFGPGLSGDGQMLFFSREGVLMGIALDSALEGAGQLESES